MRASFPNQDIQKSRDVVVPSQQQLAPWKKCSAFLFRWFLVVCFGLGLLLLVQHHSLGSSAPVNHIACDQGEQLAFHVHAHLSIYLDGQPVIIPAAIGIASSGCLYWLHTHTPDGIIHMEAPSIQSFVLGDFLDIWKQRFLQLNYPKALDTVYGWKAFVNGEEVKEDFRIIPLKTHTLITLAFQSPDIQPDKYYNWSGLDQEQ